MISVIIPVKKISNFLIDEGFPAFQKQNYKNFELLAIVDNVVNGRDNSLLKKYSWLKVIRHFGTPSEKRNFAALKAKGEILAFIDDDAYPGRDWIANIAHSFQGLQLSKSFLSSKFKIQSSKLLVAFCGPGILPKHATYLEKVFDTVLTSKLGSAAFTFRFQKEQPRFVDDYPLMNFSIKKDIFLKLKGFLNHWPGEDSKLCEEVASRGFKIQYLPDLIVYHHRKNSIKEFLLQHSRYGYKRGWFFAEGDNNSRRIAYILPSFFLFYVILLPILFILTKNELFFLPLFIYLFCIVVFADMQILKRKGLIFSLFSSFVLILLHFVYSVYFARGYVYGLLKR